jgi:hypothetical protein
MHLYIQNSEHLPVHVHLLLNLNTPGSKEVALGHTQCEVVVVRSAGSTVNNASPQQIVAWQTEVFCQGPNETEDNNVQDDTPSLMGRFSF